VVTGSGLEEYQSQRWSVEQGTVVFAFEANATPERNSILYSLRLGDGALVLRLERGPTIVARLYSAEPTGHALLDRAKSAIFRWPDDNKGVIAVSWMSRRIRDISFNGVDLYPITNPFECVSVWAEDAGPLCDKVKKDYERRSVDAFAARQGAFLSMIKKYGGLLRAGPLRALNALQEEKAQIDDLLVLIGQGKIHHLPGLSVRLRLLIYNNKGRLGLLMWAAAELGVSPRLPLCPGETPQFGDSQFSVTPPQDWEDPSPAWAHVDIGVWLLGEAATLDGKVYSNGELIRLVADKIGAHRDPDVQILIELLKGLAPTKDMLVEYMVYAGRALSHAASQVLSARDSLGH
jgi:hypothetical protein